MKMVSDAPQVSRLSHIIMSWWLSIKLKGNYVCQSMNWKENTHCRDLLLTTGDITLGGRGESLSSKA